MAAFASLDGNHIESIRLDTRAIVNRSGFRRLRIGGWRAVYTIKDGKVEVVEAGTRGDMYKQ